MKALVIGTDVTIFQKNSDARRRTEEYARFFDEYHMIIYTPRGFRPETSGKRLFLYPTNSRWIIFGPFQAVRIGSCVIRERGIHAVSVQDPAESGLAGFLLKMRFGLPLHIQLHSDFLSPYFRANSWKEFVRFLLALFIIPKGNAFRVVSRRIKDSLMRRFRIPAFKISILPIFVARVAISQAPPPVHLPERHPQFDFVILMVARLVREKNISLALEAFSEFVKEFLKSGLVIVGDGPEMENLKFKVASLNLSENVRFDGWQDDLVSYYKGADLYLLTSNFEGYGRSVIEAVATGLPVVMTDVGVAGDIIRDHETGRVVRVKDKEALVSALREAKYHYNDMRRMAMTAERLLKTMPPTSWNDYLKRYRESFS